MKTKILGLLALPLAVTVILAPTPAFAVTVTGGTVAAGVSVSVNGNGTGNTDADSAIGVPGTLSANASATQSNVTASASVSAGGTSANQGQVTVNWGWADSNTTTDGRSLQTGSFGQDNWNYSFVTGNQSGTFIANWTLAVLGPGAIGTFGLQGMYGGGGLPFNVTPNATAPVDGAGSFNVALLPNTAYTFSIFNNGNVGGSQPFNASAMFMMDWSIEGGGNAVPEPGTFALLGLGLAGLGLSRRRTAN